MIINIRSDENYELKNVFRISYGRLLFFFFLLISSSFILSYVILKTVLAVYHDPETRKGIYTQKLLLLTHELDSLQTELKARDKYFQSVLGVMNEDQSLLSDKNKNEAKSDSVQVDHENLKPSVAEQEFRKEFESNTQEINSVSSNNLIKNFESLHLFKPVEGLILQPFNVNKNHLGIDVSTGLNTPIHSIAEGTVISSEFSSEFGNTIIILHTGGFLSIYKHNSLLLKKFGDSVKSGEIIAISGNSGMHTSGPHLHFELWYKGIPLNPQHFIWF